MVGLGSMLRRSGVDVGSTFGRWSMFGRSGADLGPISARLCVDGVVPGWVGRRSRVDAGPILVESTIRLVVRHRSVVDMGSILGTCRFNLVVNLVSNYDWGGFAPSTWPLQTDARPFSFEEVFGVYRRSPFVQIQDYTGMANCFGAPQLLLQECAHWLVTHKLRRAV